MDLAQVQWEYIEPYLAKDQVRRDRRGRPWSDRRAALEGILWILRTGARWKDLPERYGSYQTVHRRFQKWREAGVMERVLQALARDLKKRAGIDVRECFIERIFAWLQNYSRLVVRWDFKLENYTAFLQLGCFLILSKYL